MGAMNELEQLRQEAEHLKNAIREGRKAACDTSLAQVQDKSLSNVICTKLPNHQFLYQTITQTNNTYVNAI